MNIFEVVGLVVLYNPNEININQLFKTAEVFKELIIINNSPENESIKIFLKNNDCPKNIIFYNNPDNLGIAQALNKGITLAFEKKYKWVVTLDQDSVFTEDTINNMISFYNTQSDEKIVSLSPFILNHNIINEEQKKLLTTVYRDVTTNITSGNLLEIKAWKQIGGFKEFLFIDAVDTEFAINLKYNGYRIVEVFSAIMNHSIGELNEVKIFNHSIYTDKHSPLRNYYITRNNIYMIKNWIFKYPKICFLLLKESIIKPQIKILLFENNKTQHFNYIIRGYFDGIKGKYGKFK
jgi:rhamnosyltransferase